MTSDPVALREGSHCCPLCGNRFADPVVHCRSCPFAAGCGTVCCPNCGYTFVEESALLNLLRGLGRRISGLRGRNAVR